MELIAACVRAEVAAAVSGVSGDSPWAVLSVRERAEDGVAVGESGSAVARGLMGAVVRRGAGRVVLLGEPAETLLLHTALALLRPGLDVAVAWDASDFSDDFARDLTVRRACQAGVIPYTSAALAAELDLNLNAARPRAAALGKEMA